MKSTTVYSFLILVLGVLACSRNSNDLDSPQSSTQPVARTPVLEEVEGVVAAEGEHFHEKDLRGMPRDWIVTTVNSFEHEDGLDRHDASSLAYVEVLPDTRITHDDSLIVGTNFFPDAGVGPTLKYNVWFNTPGVYTVWARAFSTGTEDNGVHVGLNDTWPEGGQRLQWCDGKEAWTWSSAQRVPENHCGSQGTIQIEIDEPGLHSIQFSVREDGFELDKWIMTLDEQYVPEGLGPDERIRP